MFFHSPDPGLISLWSAFDSSLCSMMWFSFGVCELLQRETGPWEPFPVFVGLCSLISAFISLAAALSSCCCSALFGALGLLYPLPCFEALISQSSATFFCVCFLRQVMVSEFCSPAVLLLFFSCCSQVVLYSYIVASVQSVGCVYVCVCWEDVSFIHACLLCK